MKTPTTTPAICSGVRAEEDDGGGGGGRGVEVGGGVGVGVVVVIIVSIVAEVVGLGVVELDAGEVGTEDVAEIEAKDVEDVGEARDVGVNEVENRAPDVAPDACEVEDDPEVPGGGRIDPVDPGGFGDRNVVGVRVSVTVVPAGGGTTIVVVVNIVVTASGTTVVVTKIVFVMVEVSSETNTVVVAGTTTVVVNVPAGCAACRLGEPSPLCEDASFWDAFGDNAVTTETGASVSDSSSLFPSRLTRDVAVIVAVCVLLPWSIMVRVSNRVDIATGKM